MARPWPLRSFSALTPYGAAAVFPASEEAEAHDAYKDRVLSTDVGDTAILSICGPEWPGQAMRAIVNDGARMALGREPEAIGDAEGRILARRSSTARRSRCRAITPSCRRAISTATSSRLA
jgi:hypothetical protein